MDAMAASLQLQVILLDINGNTQIKDLLTIAQIVALSSVAEQRGIHTSITRVVPGSDDIQMDENVLNFTSEKCDRLYLYIELVSLICDREEVFL